MSATNKNTNVSTPTFISAFVVGLVVLGALTIVYALIHAKHRKVFQPRFELSPEG
jgi:calcium permeable stress-gated cation channel